MNKFIEAVFGTVAALGVIGGCSPYRAVLGQIGANQPGYFFPESAEAERLDMVAEGVYSFRFVFDRTFLVKGPQGWLVVDSFNDRLATRLRAVLRERFNDDRVDVLVLSHYHLDHTGGIGVLAPRTIVTHRLTPAYLKDQGALARLTTGRVSVQLIEGDQTREHGGVRLKLLYLGNSHTDTLYAVYLPKQRVLFAPDMAFVRAVPPAGMPDMYYPGFMRALDRLTALDFQTFVPSHFDLGTKADVAAFRGFMLEARAAVLRARSPDGGPPRTRAEGRAAVLKVHDELEARYGHWHGFREMFLPIYIRNLAGGYLGY